MPEVLALTCPVCGGPLKPGTEQCSFCGSYIVIKTDLPKLDRHSLNQSLIQEHIVDFRQRVRVSNYDEEAHYGLGMAYYSLGLLDDAIEELTQAAKLMPENPHIQAQLAIALYDSYNAGNSAAQAQMNSRIQRALLLDPNHPEATILQAEVKIDEGRYADVIGTLQTLDGQAQDRVKQKLVGALGTACDQRLDSNNWNGARWCWKTLEPLDAKAAKELAIRVLQRWRELVPKSVNVKNSSGKKAKFSTSGSSTNGKRVGFTMLWALGAAVCGLILLLVVAVFASMVSEGDTVSGAPAVFLVIAMLLFVLSPVIGGVVYWRRSRPDRRNHHVSVTAPARTRYTREELLWGQAETSVTFEVADGIIEKLQAREKAEAFKQQLAKGRR